MKINKLKPFPVIALGTATVATPVVLTSCVQRVYLILDTIDPKLKDKPNNIRVHAALTNGHAYPHFIWSFSWYKHGADWPEWLELETGSGTIVEKTKPIDDDQYWYVDIDPSHSHGNFYIYVNCVDYDNSKHHAHMTVFVPLMG